MSSDLLKEKVIHPISTQELERRWKAARAGDEGEEDRLFDSSK